MGLRFICQKLVTFRLMFLALLGCLLTSNAFPGQSNQTTFSGQATVVRATVLGITTVLSDTGTLPPEGGERENSLLAATIPGLLTAEVLHSSTVGQGEQSRSEASVANLDLNVGGNEIGADFVTSRAVAACASGQSSLDGTSEILGLVINGQAIAVSGEPNQRITLPNGEIIINEQNRSLSHKKADITVNALHVVVQGVAEVVVSSAHADISCKGQPACGGGDFITGGGFITGTPSGAKGNFGVAGGIKNGSFWGHLVYVDHGDNLKVKGTAVTAYESVDEITRRIEGNAKIDGQSGFTYEVEVSDNGEPRRGDMFSLSLSNGYTASGPLDGGNIQLHRPCR